MGFYICLYKAELRNSVNRYKTSILLLTDKYNDVPYVTNYKDYTNGIEKIEETGIFYNSKGLKPYMLKNLMDKYNLSLLIDISISPKLCYILNQPANKIQQEPYQVPKAHFINNITEGSNSGLRKPYLSSYEGLEEELGNRKIFMIEKKNFRPLNIITAKMLSPYYLNKYHCYEERLAGCANIEFKAFLILIKELALDFNHYDLFYTYYLTTKGNLYLIRIDNKSLREIPEIEEWYCEKGNNLRCNYLLTGLNLNEIQYLWENFTPILKGKS